MAKQNLKFYRGASAPSNAIIGSIFFDTTTKEIKVKTGDSTWEAYAGKISNVVWDESKMTLTITRNDGTNKTVNFSDVASATTLQTLRDEFDLLSTAFAAEQGYIDALQTTVGDNQSGLVKDVADHTAALTKLYGSKDEEGSIANQITNSVASEATLRKNADDALGLRIDGVVSVNDTQNGRLDALEAFKNAEGAAVDKKISDAIDALAGSATSTNGALVNITVTSENGEVKTASVDESALNTRLSGIDTDIDNAVADIEKKLGGSYTETDTVAKAIKAAADAAAAAQADIDSFLKAEEVADAAIDTLKEIQDWIASDETGTEALIGRVAANESAIDTLEGKVDVEKVSTAIATAKGEAIAAAATDAETKANSAKEAAIAAAKTETTTQVTELGKSVTANDTAIKALDAAIKDLDVTDAAVDGEYVSAVSQTDGKIAVSRLALPSATVGESAVASGKHVAVEVVEVKGKITAVNVNENDIASASELTRLTTKVVNIESALETILVWEEF